MITLTTEQAQQIDEALVATTLNKDYWLEKCMDSLDTIRAARAQEQAEPDPVYAFRRKGQDSFCTCDKERYEELSDKPNLFEVTTFYAAPQPVSQEYQDHLVNQSFDWASMAAKHQFMEGYRIGLAEMRERCAKVCDDIGDSDNGYGCAAAIRAIKFEGDTGFRYVSEMIAEHKQDPKKAAAIEKAKMRKAEQEPVAFHRASFLSGYEAAQSDANACDVPPQGWICTRQAGHDGPCAAIADNNGHELVSRAMSRLAEQDAAPVGPVKQEPVAWKCVCGANLYIDSNGSPASKAEQAEQEPMYFGLTHDHNWLSISEQQYNKLSEAGRMKVYAAPVHTVDLTDDEIHKCMNGNFYNALDFARAVIAADREKNK